MGTRSYVRPVVVVSKCLGFDACRWDGKCKRNALIRALRPHVRFLPVCPELEIGLGVPRDPIRLVRTKEGLVLYQPSTRRRLTRDMTGFARRYLASLRDVDGFILKRRSPSCGIDSVKVFGTFSPHALVSGKNSGLFAAEALRQFPGLPFEDEERLLHDNVRERWLTRLFLLVAFRAARKSGSSRRLASFHACNELLLKAHSQKQTRKLTRIITDRDHNEIESTFAEYERGLHLALRRGVRRQTVIKILKLTLAHYRSHLDIDERRSFLQTLHKYRQGKTSLCSLRKAVRVWGVRYDKLFIRNHSFFRPYPDRFETSH